MSDFHCPLCRKSLNVNKKLSVLKTPKESDRIYFYVCNGQSKQSPHGPCIWKYDTQAVTVDSFGRLTMKVSRVFRVWIEDADLHEELDQFKDYMQKQRGERLLKSDTDSTSVG